MGVRPPPLPQALNFLNLRKNRHKNAFFTENLFKVGQIREEIGGGVKMCEK